MFTDDFNEQHYATNLELFTSLDPLTAYQVDLILDHYEWRLCLTDQREPNLVKTRYGIKDYYYAQSGALEETEKDIHSSSLLEKADVIYFYGLGFGYAYDVLESWLHQNPSRRLVFLEDDLEVVYYFLHTARATAILQDPQVFLFYFKDYSQQQERFYQLHSNFIGRKVDFLVLPYYAMRHEAKALALCYNTLYDLAIVEFLYGEYLSGQQGFLKNFYRNLLHLPQSEVGDRLFGTFKGIPAIICGAGPSIHKNIERLKTLKDRALIFAGGSSLNVLNHFNLIPHFGIGIDPNPEQYHRLLTNDTFHLPFFYRPRLSHEALQLMQGPKLYISGSTNRLARWFEEHLGIASSPMDEGHNVVNFCTQIAYFLGCSPIIYVGMDLAFTNVQSYASGINVHPLWIHHSRPYATDYEQRLVLRSDIYGNTIKTKWDWVAEANWLGHFAKRYPSLPMINATEGGLGFAPIPSLTLEEVAHSYLTRQYDLDGLIHSRLQLNASPLKQSTILQLIQQFKDSLHRCIDLCIKIIKEKELQISADPALASSSFYTAQTILDETQLHQEIAYDNFLVMFDHAYRYFQHAREILNHRKTKEDFAQQLTRYAFLRSILIQHLDLLVQSVRYFIQFPPPVFVAQEPSPTSQEGDIYEYKDHHLRLYDRELDLDIDERYEPEEAIKASRDELLHEFYLLQGQLHGPSRFYTEDHTLLSESWFIQGQREGKSYHYDRTGRLYSIQRFRHGLYQDKQEFFFDNGRPHVIMHYDKGKLDGPVWIYTVEGHLLRELHYRQGQRHGVERMWDTNGTLIIECEYIDGKPIGRARQWHANGTLAQVIDIHRFPQDYDLMLWNEQGKLTHKFIHGVEDFSMLYQETREKVEKLEAAFNDIFEKMDPFLEEQGKATQDYQQVKESLQELMNLKRSLSSMK